MTATESWRPEELELMLRFIDERCGLHIRSDQLTSTAKLIRRTMERLGCGDIAELKSELAKNTAAMNALVNELTVGETYFFREPKHFQFMQEVIIPEAQQRLEGSRPMHIWSAACASGEEAYSVAMICDRLGCEKTTRIVATDISHAALEKARRGQYRNWSFRGNSLQHAAGYIQPQGDVLKVREEIQNRVDFRYLNLAADTYQAVLRDMAPLDLILCRNVFIYFSRDTIVRVVRRMFDCMVEGGWLLTASADPPLTALGDLEVKATELGIFYRKPLQANHSLQIPLRTLLPFYPTVASPIAVPQPADQPEDAAPADNSGMGTGAPGPGAPGTGVPDPGTGTGDEIARPRVGKAEEPRQPAPDSLPAGVAARRLESIPQAVAAARVAYAHGDLPRTIAVTEPIRHDLAACVLNLQAKAQRNADEALVQFPTDLANHSLSPELHYLYAVLLLDTGRIDEAYKSVQRAVFLDRSLAVPHFLLGSIQQQRGQLEAAWRHYRNARDLCATLPPNALVPLGEGSTASVLSKAAQDRMNLIGPRVN